MPFMLPIIIRNLFGGPVTRMYPIAKREPFLQARGHIECTETLCNLCGICSRHCPAIAIDINEEDMEWVLHPDRCIVCGVCTEACPTHAIIMDAKWRAPLYGREPIIMYAKAVKERQ